MLLRYNAALFVKCSARKAYCSLQECSVESITLTCTSTDLANARNVTARKPTQTVAAIPIAMAGADTDHPAEPRQVPREQAAAGAAQSATLVDPSRRPRPSAPHPVHELAARLQIRGDAKLR
eukprot:scaffold630_cov399-Prasinococcus_capsulatus_cf.AAC.26